MKVLDNFGPRYLKYRDRQVEEGPRRVLLTETNYRSIDAIRTQLKDMCRQLEIPDDLCPTIPEDFQQPELDQAHIIHDEKVKVARLYVPLGTRYMHSCVVKYSHPAC